MCDKCWRWCRVRPCQRQRSQSAPDRAVAAPTTWQHVDTNVWLKGLTACRLACYRKRATRYSPQASCARRSSVRSAWSCTRDGYIAARLGWWHTSGGSELTARRTSQSLVGGSMTLEEEQDQAAQSSSSRGRPRLHCTSSCTLVTRYKSSHRCMPCRWSAACAGRRTCYGYHSVLARRARACAGLPWYGDGSLQYQQWRRCLRAPTMGPYRCCAHRRAPAPQEAVGASAPRPLRMGSHVARETLAPQGAPPADGERDIRRVGENLRGGRGCT